MGGLMDGEVAIVTGAGGGIGREIAVAMALEGAAVVVNDIGAGLGGEGASRYAGPADGADHRTAWRPRRGEHGQCRRMGRSYAMPFSTRWRRRTG